MAAKERYKVVKIDGLRYSGRQRGIGFLTSEDDKNIDAKKVFDTLDEKSKGDVLNRFDHWLDGGIWDQYHHGWPNDPDHKNCYSFRWRKGKVRHRFYGFKYKTDDFFVCILVSHDSKTEEHTDMTHLDRAEALRATLDVIRAMKKRFPH